MNLKLKCKREKDKKDKKNERRYRELPTQTWGGEDILMHG